MFGSSFHNIHSQLFVLQFLIEFIVHVFYYVFFVHRLKDIAQNDKSELSAVTKSNKELGQQVSTIAAERDKLQGRLHEAIEQVDDLKEQV